MFDIILSDQAIRDRKRYASHESDCLKAFGKAIQKFTSINDFLIQTRIPDRSEIKRLNCEPMAWRHRTGNFRTIFTISTVWGESLPAFIILRIAPRKNVYEGLERHVKIEPSILQLLHNYKSTDEKEDEYEDEYENQFIAQQLSKPQIIARYNQQGEDTHYADKSRLRIHQLRGGAGTGKTTSISQLALEAVNQGAYPIVIVPNRALQVFGKKFIKKEQSDLIICETLNNISPSNFSNLAILTKDHFLQYLAGDIESALSNSVGNFKIRQTLTEKGITIPDYLNNINLYSLYLGIKAGAYQESVKDPLLRELEDLGAVKFICKPHHQRFLKEALAERDAASQVERIEREDQYYKFSEIMSQLLNIADDKIVKPPILMIDEVQDFYWCQLKAILKFYRICFPMDKQVENRALSISDDDKLSVTFHAVSKDAGRLVIIAGDNNQRVTFSGFSWDNLTTNFQRDFPNHEPFESPDAAFFCNYRNSSEITRAANYILSAQATQLKAFKINTQGCSWIDPPPSPEKCKHHDAKPKLIETDESWFKQLIDALALRFLDCNKRIVFIYNENSEKYQDLWEHFKNICKQVDHLEYFTVAEAKGQEFEGVIIVFPFARCPEKPSINEFFTWYTALTRAKQYVAILISPDEKRWLEEKTNTKDLETVFEISKISNKDDLSKIVEELSEKGIDTKTDHDRVNSVLRKIEEWLKAPSSVKINNLLRKIPNIWQYLDEIEIQADEFRKEVHVNETSFKNFSLEKCEAREALVIYIILLPLLLEIIGDKKVSIVDAQVIRKLENYFKKNPQEINNFQNKVRESMSLCIIYRASQQSWEAAKVLKDSSSVSKFLYQQISQDLINRGLPWEASRLRYHYLQEKHQQSLPFPELLERQDDPDELTDLLVSHLWDEVTQFSNQAKEAMSHD